MHLTLKEDLIEGCKFAHDRGKKVYVTTNVIPHQKDKEGFNHLYEN